MRRETGREVKFFSVSVAVCEPGGEAARLVGRQMIRTRLSNRAQSEMSGTVSALSKGKRD